TPVTLAVNSCAAPLTGIGATPLGADRYGTFSMKFFPGTEVFFQVDFFPVGQGQFIDLPDLLPCRSLYYLAVFSQKSQAGDSGQVVVVVGEGADQFGHRLFPFADHEEIGTGVQVTLRVVSNVGPSQHNAG